MTPGPQDKHGTPLSKGDLIDFVHAGEHHTAEIEGIVTDELSHLHHLTVSLTTRIPAGSVTRLDKPRTTHPHSSRAKGT